MVEPFPKDLLSDTLWDFAGQPSFLSKTAFVSAVLRYHLEARDHAPGIDPEESWQPASPILRFPRILIRYYCDPPGEVESWRAVELASEDGASFTAGELLYKLHNAIIEDVRGNGHHWFEGLGLEAITAAGVPVYCLIPGS